MATKTNAIRIVQQARISCTEQWYEFNENDLNGNHAAKAIGMPAEQVYKTLVARGASGTVYVFCIPVCCELDLKKAAKSVCEKNIVLVAVKELLALTGYIRGGCSPVGMKKKYATYIHTSCKNHSKMAVSGGLCGVTLLLSPDDLISATDGMVCDIIKEI